jgi:hypothetical protein
MLEVVAFTLHMANFEVNKPNVKEVVALLAAVDENSDVFWNSNIVNSKEEEHKRLVKKRLAMSAEVVSTFPGFKSFRKDENDGGLTIGNSFIEEEIAQIFLSSKEEEIKHDMAKIREMFSALKCAAVLPDGWGEEEKKQHYLHATYVMDRLNERNAFWDEKFDLFLNGREGMHYSRVTNAEHSFDVTAFTEGAEARMHVTFFPPRFINNHYINGGFIKLYNYYNSKEDEKDTILIMFENGFSLLLLPLNRYKSGEPLTLTSGKYDHAMHELVSNGINPKAHPTRSVLAWRTMKKWFCREIFQNAIKYRQSLPGFHSFSNDTELGSKGHSFDIFKLKASATADDAASTTIFEEKFVNVKLSPPTFMGGEAAFLWQPLKNDFDNIFIGFESGRYIGLVKDYNQSSFVKKALEIQQCWIKHYKM